MEMSRIDDVAQRLYRAHGDQAEAEAARKARDCDKRGDSGEAGAWRSVRERIRILRGPNES